jgi:hypothetical protein
MSRPARARNGLDFNWDQQPENLGNCWPQNTGPDGTRGSLVADPPMADSPNTSNDPMFLPERCTRPPADPSSPANHQEGTSTGNPVGYSEKFPVLLACYGQYETDTMDAAGCTWWDTPPRPGTSASRAEQRTERRQGEAWTETAAGRRLRDWVREFAGSEPFGPSN